MLKNLLIWGVLGWAWLCAGAEIGVEAWVQRYGEINGASEDHPNKVVVDANGDVIIAGYSDDSAPGTHGLLIKYSNNGIPVWTNRFNGGAGTYDEANDITVDSAGSIYAAGASFQSNGFPNYIVIKYAVKIHVTSIATRYVSSNNHLTAKLSAIRSHSRSRSRGTL